MATTTFTSVPGLNKALKKLPKDASRKLRVASKAVAAKVADDARSRATTFGGVAKLVVSSIRAISGTVPIVKMGNTMTLPTEGNGWSHTRTGTGQTIGDIIFGAEFGGQRRATTGQFYPWRGNGRDAGYFLYPAIRGDDDWIQSEYSDALNDALQNMKATK